MLSYGRLCVTLSLPYREIAVDLRASGVEGWLVDAVDRLARGDSTGIEAYLCTVGQPINLAETKATVRTHFVRTDANGYPRIRALCDKLADRVVDYCIPRSRIQEALRHANATQSTEKLSQLAREARGLFTKLERSGEGGELLLYFLLEAVLRIPQILCKMSLKTSSQMHFHGADGLHAKVLNNGSVALYWGESKMRGTVTSAIDECLGSLAPYLLGEMSSARTRDLILLRDNLDLGSEDLTDTLVRYFTADMPESGRLEFRGACLVGFSMNNYPSLFQDNGASIREDIVDTMTQWTGRISTRVNDHKLESCEIEIFCIPFPSVDDFRSGIRISLGFE
jgi:HamA